jgi:hypothetical protein
MLIYTCINSQMDMQENTMIVSGKQRPRLVTVLTPVVLGQASTPARAWGRLDYRVLPRLPEPPSLRDSLRLPALQLSELGTRS